MRYVRHHTAAISPYTGEPYGIFVAVWHLVRDGRTDQSETRLYWEHRTWFEANLPIPPFHAEGNPQRAITWFKEAALTREMELRLDFYFGLARKHGLEIHTNTRADAPGIVIYEDEFQIAVTGRSGVV